MIDVKKLIESVMSEALHKVSSESGDKIYRDEPILKTAAQMSNYLPEKYRQMRKMAGGSFHDRRSEACVFYEQGKFMEDYEDAFDYRGEFIRYFPTYQSMNNEQLRGYFSWRTALRRGKIEPTSLSFAFVYVYELLNQIGVKTPEEGYRRFYDFWRAYREIDSRIDWYAKQWLMDYVVYYGLDRKLLAPLYDSAAEESVLTLLHYPSREEAEIFAALCACSTYHLEHSKFYKQYPQDVSAVACAVFARLSEYYEKNRKHSYCEKLFGRVERFPYSMFRSAVFYERGRHKDCEYAINELHVYRCVGGNWVCKRRVGGQTSSRELGAMLKTVDRMMRETYGFPSRLKPTETTKLLSGIIQKEIDLFLEQKRRNAAPRVEIDLSKLQGIRRSSDVIRDKLIVEEEEEPSFVPEKPVSLTEEESSAPAAMPEPEPEEKTAPSDRPDGLSEAEYALLHSLLYDGDWREAVKRSGGMLSVLVDSVNEKLFDRFADTVIVFEDDFPVLIGDYCDELKGMISR